MNDYAFVATETETQNLIKLIDKEKHFSGTWCEPIRHPVDEACLIPIDWNQLRGCETILAGLRIVTKQQAQAEGWYFGPFSGTLAREKQKMEDIYFLFDAIVTAYGKPNFPALRSHILSYLSACYALKESLKQKAKHEKLKPIISIWWAARAREITASGELLHVFERYMNTEKHGGALTGQLATIDVHPIAMMSGIVVTTFPVEADPNTFEITAEGAFMTAYKGTPMERRFPVGIHEAKYEAVVSNPPSSHLGKPLPNLTLLQMLLLIRDYYANLLFEAGRLLGEGPKDLPVMVFEENTKLAVAPRVEGS